MAPLLKEEGLSGTASGRVEYRWCCGVLSLQHLRSSHILTAQERLRSSTKALLHIDTYARSFGDRDKSMTSSGLPKRSSADLADRSTSSHSPSYQTSVTLWASA